MAKSDIIAILAEGDVLRGVKYTQRGRDGWICTGGGIWPLKDPVPEEEETDDSDALAKAAEDALTEKSSQEAGDVVAEDTPLVRALNMACAELGGNKVVLGLSLSRLMTRIFRVPIELREDLESAVTLQMDKLSPFPGEEQTVGYEVLSETETELWVFAAAMPEIEAEKIDAAMKLAKFRVVRTDVAILGWFRSLCGSCHLTRPGRHAVLINPDGSWNLMLLDSGVPVLVRNLGGGDDPEALTRELTVSLMGAELEFGAIPLDDIQMISPEAPSLDLCQMLKDRFGIEVHVEQLQNRDGGVEGIALRAGEGAVLDLTPKAWRDALRERSIRKRVMWATGAAAAVAVLGIAVLFIGPFVYRQMTQHIRKEARRHATAYKRVSDTRERVKLIGAYTDRSKSALEILRIISSVLPEGITLTSMNYKRSDGVKISGEADAPTLVYEFKNAVTENKLFENVTLTGPSASRGKHKFDIHASFEGTGEAKK